MIDLREQLQKHFGLDDFRPSQDDVIRDALAGHAVMCVMPTGAGKSLCYQLPAVILGEQNGGGITLVVSPLISLMSDQVQQLRDEGLSAEMLSSSQGAVRQREVLSSLAKGWSGLLYVSPERFASPGFANLLPQLQVNLLAIDEAHCVSQWGHDFRPEYSQLGTFRARLGNPTTIALTATATQDVRGDIIAQLGLENPHVYVTGFDRPNLRYGSERIESAHRLGRTIELLREQPGSSIVYCSTRKNVDEVTLALRSALRGRQVVPYHAGLDTDDRTASQEAFMNGDNVVAVCTNAFGMGVNKPDTRLVVHYNLPGTLEAYYQEAGRAGRDGQPADCVLLFTYADRKTQEFFISKLGQGDEHADPEIIEQRKQHSRDKLDLMTDYAQNHRCRRQGILDYFGDTQIIESASCYCDVCRKGRVDPAGMPAVALLPEETVTIVKKILAGIARTGGKFGATTVAEMLAGADTERTTRFALSALTTFGILKAHGVKPVVAMLHRVMEAGLARQKDPPGTRNRPVVELTAVGVMVMKGTRPPPTSLADIVPLRGGKASAYGSRSSSTSPAYRDRASSFGRSRAGDGDDEPQAIELDSAAEERFQKLRAARAELAREHGMPPYVIAHDRALKLVAIERPTDVEGLARVKGFGPNRAQKYGDHLLRALTGGAPSDGKSSSNASRPARSYEPLPDEGSGFSDDDIPAGD